MTSKLPLLKFTRGTSVCYQNRHYVIAQESGDLETVSLFDSENSCLVTALIKDLTAFPTRVEKPEIDLPVVTEEAWAKALDIFKIIEPLAFLRRRSLAQVKERAQQCGVGVSTLYGWLKDFDRIGKVSVFLRKTRSDKGKRAVSLEAEAVIKKVLEEHYLSEQKLSPAKVAKIIDFECKQKSIAPPHSCTVRNRIKEISRYEKTKAREGRKAADEQSLIIKRHFDDPIAPLQLVQVDHTPIDLSLVDDVYRQPIGRPWLTLLIDVFSRMVLGFVISLDPPGNLSLGLCLSHAFLPKEKWLSKLGIESKWPCWGIPRTIHADNAKEFRGEMLTLACREYGINLEWRPVATPRYGAHIERYLGTLNSSIHALPGTTFSNVAQKGEYDPDGKAVMTLAELEQWVTYQIIDIYHQEKHSGIGMPPLEKWKQGLIGTKRSPGIGMPARISNELKLKLDLMPFELRTVQDYGITWDHIEYRHDILRRWVNEMDPDQPKLKRKFVCRRDPRDVSVIWFWDPGVCEYFPIPYRNTSHPAISLWELRASTRQAEQENIVGPMDEMKIFAAYEHQRQIENQAKEKTKKIRRQEQRTRLGLKNSIAHVPRQSDVDDNIPEARQKVPAHQRRDIKPFEVDET